MVNKKFIKNFNKMNFKTNEIVVVLISQQNKIIAEMPILNSKIINTKNIWKLKASPSIFKNIIINENFKIGIINKSVDNIIIMLTDLYQAPIQHLNDIEIRWADSGIVYLNKI